MSSHSPVSLGEPRLARVRWWMLLAIVTLIGVAAIFDGRIVDAMPPRRDRISDMQGLLRTGGFLPTWLFLGVILVWSFPDRRIRVRIAVGGAYVVLSAAVAGGLAAVLKIVVRRPDLAWDAPYAGWRWASLGSNPLDGTDLCCPSEHAAVAFGATLMLARLHPRIAVPTILFGFGTAWSRVRHRSHHPSDTMVSLLVAVAGTLLVQWLGRQAFRRIARRRAGAGSDND